MPSPPVVRQPFSTVALDAAIARDRAALPQGAKLRATGSVTTEGARVSILRQWGQHTYVGGYAERQWGGGNWVAGAQAVFVR